MLVRSLLVVLCCVLPACGTTQKKTLEAETAKSAAGPVAEGAMPTPTGSFVNRILETARDEWIYFGQQKVVIDEDGESIPHVGMWEDEDRAHIERVNSYWRAVGYPGLSGTDCGQPWSAAFLSWVMRMAGVPKTLFPPSSSHSIYLFRFMADADNPGAVFIPHAISDYKPKPGDLICASRANSIQIDAARLPIAQALERAKLHCDIVLETSGRYLQAIGGNVRNSVSKTYLTLSREGHLQPTQRRPWFMVVENRLD